MEHTKIIVAPNFKDEEYGAKIIKGPLKQLSPN
ncbi:hypothetical protein G5S_0080 [Chlamydia pecorum E58]|uniref:Uncharacterized protein n=1 Tax=Chlamydia pecorum (strain ATCC VR-628 / DSM 29919 / E58) TaxID=331635 RepID=A0AA34RCJ5_CHLPE|nr:hypothetical protein G5S_0080 [Chlamydia pecorum E58]